MDKMDLSGLDLPEKEKLILESAIQVFSEKGFSAATTSEIAKNAGVAEGTIFRYFKTKKDILRGILIQTMNMFSEKIVISGVEKIFNNIENKDLRAIMRELAYDRLKLVDSVFPMARIILSEALYHEDVREAIYQNIILKASSTFSEFYAKMVERGMLRSDVEPMVIFRSAMGNMFLLIAQKKLFGDKFNLDDMETEIGRAIDVLLYGIVPPKKAEDGSAAEDGSIEA